MRKSKTELFRPLSKQRLKGLIKNHGLQTSIFDRSLLVFDWEGLEYQFQIFEGVLYLYCVRMPSDVVLGELGDLPVY